MSGGKKKSGFQITSVTTDYGPAAMESPKSSFPGDSSGPQPQPQQPAAGNTVTNGGPSMTHSPPLTSQESGKDRRSSLGHVGIVGGEGPGETRAPLSDPVAFSGGGITTAGLAGAGVGSLSNGPALLDPKISLHSHMSSSQPGSPVTKRKQVSQEHGGSNSPHSSRFRVVRLGQGLGEPYRRGRWTCVDFLEREGGEERGLRRVMNSMRHAHSLESLETVGLSGFEGGGGGTGTMMKPLGHIRALRTGHLVHSQGTTHLLAPHLGGDEGAPRKPFVDGPAKVDLQKGSPAFRPQTLSSGPPSPTHMGHPNLKLGESTAFDPSASYSPQAPSPQARQDSRLLSPTKPPSESVRSRPIPSPLRLNMDAVGKSVLRETRSQPTSPSAILPRTPSFHQGATPIQTPSALSLAQSMFGVGGAFELGSVKKIVSAFETRRQPRPRSLPPSLPDSYPSKLSPRKSPKPSSQLPAASSTSPGSILANPSPRWSPPVSRSSSAPSSPTLRRTACFSISSSGPNAPSAILRSSHPNLHIASHRMASGPHHTPPAPTSRPQRPVTPPPVPRLLKLPRGVERREWKEGLGSGHAGSGVRSSWPSSRTELCGCGRQRCPEVMERRSPGTSISCEKMGQSSSRESPPNLRTSRGPSISHNQAALGKTAKGASGDSEISTGCFGRLKMPALPSPVPLSIPRKQKQTHSPTLTRKHTLSVSTQPITDPGLPPFLKLQSYRTHGPDLGTEKDLAVFNPIKTGAFCPPFLEFAQIQNQGLALNTIETNRAACLGSNVHQSQDQSGCPCLRAQGSYWDSNPIDTCDRQTQTESHCDLIMHQSGSVGYISKEVQTVNVGTSVSTAQLISRKVENSKAEIHAPSPSKSPGLNSRRDVGQNSELWTGSASFRHGQNGSSGAYQAQDLNGNKLCLPSSVVNLGSLNSTVGSHRCVVSRDLKVGASPATSELSSSVICSHPTAPCNLLTSVTGAAGQGPVHTTATGHALQGPVHTTATGHALQGPVLTPATEANVLALVHTTGTGHTLQGPVHTTATGHTLQGPVHTTATGHTLQGPVHTTATGHTLQGPVHTTATGHALQRPVHTTATGHTLQGPVHTTATGHALRGPVPTTAPRPVLQGPVHSPATGNALQVPVHTPAIRANVQGPIHTPSTEANVQGPVHTTASGVPIPHPVHSTAAMQGYIRGEPVAGLSKTSDPFPHGAGNMLHPSRAKPHVEATEPKKQNPEPVTLTRNSDKAFLSLLLFIHSGSSNSMIAIDNKIEQAMDLVKTHLMMAVREEVEVLREQIKELSERNAQLEKENFILRALRERD